MDLDTPPAVTRRELLRETWRHLDVVVHYGLDEIKDRIDREHLVKAHTLLREALK